MLVSRSKSTSASASPSSACQTSTPSPPRLSGCTWPNNRLMTWSRVAVKEWHQNFEKFLLPDDQFDTAKSSLEQFDSLLVRLSLNTHLALLSSSLSPLSTSSSSPSSSSSLHHQWIDCPPSLICYCINSKIMTRPTPFTESSWSPLFNPPWRSATPPAVHQHLDADCYRHDHPAVHQHLDNCHHCYCFDHHCCCHRFDALTVVT